MVELSEQLDALLGLEAKYSTRDYLLDLASQNKCCCSTTPQTGNCDDDNNCTTSPGRITPSCADPSVSTKTVSNTEEGEERNSTTPMPPRTVPQESLLSRSTVVTEQRAVAWREKICEWAYQVADHFDLTRDLVYITLNYLDRVCSASHTLELLRDKSRFQLLAMASLCLAIKLHGGMDLHDPGTESSIIETILHLGRGHFTVEQLKAMELETLQRLQWCMNPPTPQSFVSYILELRPPEERTEINDIALYLIELAVHDYYLILSKPSVLALAALANAGRMLGHTDAWINDVQEDLLPNQGYEKVCNIEVCNDRLDRLYANSGTKLEDFLNMSSPDNNKQLSPTSIVEDLS